MYCLLDAYMSHDETLHELHDSQFCDEYDVWADSLPSMYDDDIECGWHVPDAEFIRTLEAEAPLFVSVKATVLA